MLHLSLRRLRHQVIIYLFLPNPIHVFTIADVRKLTILNGDTVLDFQTIPLLPEQ